MVAPIIWGLIALGMAACETSRSSRREEYYPKEETPSWPEVSELLPPAVLPDDRCPGEDYCACAEGVGWVPGIPVYFNDHFVRIGSKVVDTKKELHTIKHPRGWRMRIDTIIPDVDFQFQLGSAEPTNPMEFKRQASFLTNELLKVLLGKYPCFVEKMTDNPVIYVTGHTDRLGDEMFNLNLSKARALRVGEDIRYWLEVNRNQLRQPVWIKYVGLGESQAKESGDVDEIPNLKQRRVDVVTISEGEPFQADWQALGKVEPIPSSPSVAPLTPMPLAPWEPAPPTIPPASELRDWRVIVSKSIQKEIRQSCGRENSGRIQACVEFVARRLVASAEKVCSAIAVKEGLTLENCRNTLLKFPWLDLSELQRKSGGKISNIISLMEGPNPLEASDGSNHRSILTFIDREAAIFR